MIAGEKRAAVPRNYAESLGAVVAQIPFSPQIAWQLAAIGCKYYHDLFVKPDIHRGGIIGIAIVVKLLCEFLTRKETAIYGQKLHQIDDGVSPIELLGFFVAQGVEHCGDIHCWPRRRRR